MPNTMVETPKKMVELTAGNGKDPINMARIEERVDNRCRYDHNTPSTEGWNEYGMYEWANRQTKSSC